MSLATIHPEIADEWHPTRNGNLTAKDVLPHTMKKVWWLCTKTCEHLHEWQAAPDTRVSGRGCPYCCNKIICPCTCLATKFPDLAREWHPSKNKKLTPDTVSPHSSTKVWWLCTKKNKEHTWRTAISSRTTNGTGCPRCRESKGEKAVEKWLKENNIIYDPQMDLANLGCDRHLRFDFYVYLPELNKYAAVEFDGIQHFYPIRKNWKGRKNFKTVNERDRVKDSFCKDQCIPLLRIAYNDYDKVSGLLQTFLDNPEGIVYSNPELYGGLRDQESSP